MSARALASHCGRGPLAATMGCGGAMLRGSSLVLILFVLGLAMLAGAVGGSWERFPPAAYAESIEPVRPGQEDSIRRAVFADRRLWLLSDAGEIWAVSKGDGRVRAEPLADVALDLCVQRGRPTIVTAPRHGAVNWRLQRWQDMRWADVANIRVKDEGFVAIACEPDSLIVITSRRLIELGAHPRVTVLSNRVPTRPANVVMATPAYVFVGLNAGEWGGGLQRIDRRTGQVRVIERNETGELCGGPLNVDCDPVNGVARSPRTQGCVVAAVGLVHMMTSGGLVEICGDHVASLYREPCSEDRMSSRCATPFFGLIRSGDALLAVAPDKLVSLGVGGQVSELVAPPFQAYGPFQIGFGPSYVLVKTSANGRRSLSGSTPLIIPR